MQDSFTLGNCWNSNVKLSLPEVYPLVPLQRKTSKLAVTWLPSDDTLCRSLITRYGPSILGQGIQSRCQWPSMVLISPGLTSRNVAPPRHGGGAHMHKSYRNYIHRWNVSQKTQKQKYCHWDSSILTLKKQHYDLQSSFWPLDQVLPSGPSVITKMCWHHTAMLQASYRDQHRNMWTAAMGEKNIYLNRSLCPEVTSNLT